MGAPLPYQNEIFTLHFSVGIPQQPNDDLFALTAHAYGERLKSIAAKLFKEDWFALTKESDDFKVIISGVKDVIDVLGDLETDPRINMELVLKDLYNILYLLHRAGERSGEKFAIRELKHKEFGECHENLKRIADILTIRR
jgi:hypothetical protein